MLLKHMKQKEKPLCWSYARVNTFHSDRIGFQVTVCHQTGCYMEQMESWFDAGQVALFPIVLKRCQPTCVPEAGNMLACFVLQCQ